MTRSQTPNKLTQDRRIYCATDKNNSAPYEACSCPNVDDQAWIRRSSSNFLQSGSWISHRTNYGFDQMNYTDSFYVIDVITRNLLLYEFHQI